MKIRSEEFNPTVTELKPKRDLLDPKFNGYKLSLESLPSYFIDLETEVDKVYPTGEQYSLQHIKLFATHNHIVADHWNASAIYVIDKDWNILKLKIDVESGTLSPVTKVWSIPSTDSKVDGRYNVTLDFSDKAYAVVADGCGNLYVLATGNRAESSNWNVVFQKSLFENKKWKQFLLLGTSGYTQEESNLIDVLVCRIDEKSEWQRLLGSASNPNIPEHSFVSAVEWITLSEDGNNEWAVNNSRTLVGRNGFDYCSVERNGSAVYLASDDEYFFSTGGEQLECPGAVEDQEASVDADLKRYAYLWMQSNENITVWIKLPGNASASDIVIDVGLQKIRVHFKEWLLIDGILQNKVVKDEFKWSIEVAEGPSSFPLQRSGHLGSVQYLEIILQKHEKNVHWEDNLISDETFGKLLDTKPENEDIHNILSDLCSNRWGEAKDSSCLDSQLEDCDSFPAFTSCLMRIDRDQQRITDKVSLNSHQWLFNVRIDEDKIPAICVRHDVDGVVWQPEIREHSPENRTKLSWELDHVGTFSAFGYVQASKQQRKYTVCPPDLSYVAVCDSKKHVYVYHQPKEIENSLRNRKTGESVNHIAKQQIIAVDPPTEIIGAYASNDFLFILTSKRLTACRVKALVDP